MKKGIILFLSILLCFSLAACAAQETTPPVSEQSSRQEQPNIQNNTEGSEIHRQIRKSRNHQATQKRREIPKQENEK